MIFIYEKNGGAVAMTASNTKNKFSDKFAQVSIALESGEKKKIDSNDYDIFIKENKLIFKEKLHLIDRLEKEKTKKDIDKIQDENIKNIIKKIIK